MDVLNWGLDFLKYSEEIVSAVTILGGIFTTLFVKDARRKTQLLEIIDDVQEGNEVLQELARKKNLLGAAKEIGKLIKK